MMRSREFLARVIETRFQEQMHSPAIFANSAEMACFGCDKPYKVKRGSKRGLCPRCDDQRRWAATKAEARLATAEVSL